MFDQRRPKMPFGDDDEIGNGSIFKGIVVLLAGLVALAVVLIVALSVLGGNVPFEVFIAPLLVPGITQLVIAIPAIRLFQAWGEPETIKGILVAAAVIFILNAACWGVPLVGSIT